MSDIKWGVRKTVSFKIETAELLKKTSRDLGITQNDLVEILVAKTMDLEMVKKFSEPIKELRGENRRNKSEAAKIVARMSKEQRAALVKKNS